MWCRSRSDEHARHRFLFTPKYHIALKHRIPAETSRHMRDRLDVVPFINYRESHPVSQLHSPLAQPRSDIRGDNYSRPSICLIRYSVINDVHVRPLPTLPEAQLHSHSHHYPPLPRLRTFSCHHTHKTWPIDRESNNNNDRTRPTMLPRTIDRVAQARNKLHLRNVDASPLRVVHAVCGNPEYVNIPYHYSRSTVAEIATV